MSKCGTCSNKLKSAENNVCYKCCNEELEKMKSEALMYAEFHRSSASKDNIVRTMCGFFKSDELRAAKSLIYERFRSLDILENAADRRTTENRSDLMAMCCDTILRSAHLLYQMEGLIQQILMIQQPLKLL